MHRTEKLVAAVVGGILAGAVVLACGGNKPDAQAPASGARAASPEPSGEKMSCGGHTDGGSCHAADPAKK